MVGYRLYCINQSGSIVGVEDAHCPSDQDALEHARSLLDDKDHCHGIEVWERARLVGRVPENRAA
jgi:hypothetical protein